MNYISILRVVAIVIVIVLLLPLFLEMLTLHSTGVKQVDCYDSNGDRIIGQTCERIIYCGIISEALGCGG